jgi:hypothetical protein
MSTYKKMHVSSSFKIVRSILLQHGRFQKDLYKFLRIKPAVVYRLCTFCLMDCCLLHSTYYKAMRMGEGVTVLLFIPTVPIINLFAFAGGG